MSIRLLQANPKAQYLAQRAEIDAAVLGVLSRGLYILGEEVAAFEREFAAYVGVAHGLGVASGTDAIVLALKAAGVGPGDAVFTVSHTAVATVAAIELAGAVPVLVDIEEETYTMSAASLDEAIVMVGKESGLRPRAVIPVHLYGHPCDLASLQALAGRHGLVILEDCAQAHGAAWNERKVGTFGHVAAFSFYPTKNLGAIGDGGALVTNDPGLFQRAGMLRQYGWQERFMSQVVGMNSRLDELQAAILRVKLKRLDVDNEQRRKVAARYHELLTPTGLRLPVERRGARHVYHQFVVRTAGRDSLRKFLAALGIGTAIHYPAPVHQQLAYAGRLRVAPGGLPITERIRPEIVSLPMHPQLTLEDADEIAGAVAEWSHTHRDLVKETHS